jgi:ferredoxin-NADP reductase
MSPFRTQLRRREAVADQTMAFHFERPSDFQFKAGQTVDLTLIDPPETDAEGNTRTFSIASSPQDSDFFIATRMRGSAFKRVLASVPLGTVIEADGPMGSFTLHHNVTKSAVFLAGGIGITPFRSIIHDAAARNLTQRLWLFYSNNRPEDAPFLDDLQNVAHTTPSFQFVPTMTKMAESKQPWRGETGLINRDMMTRHLSDLRGPVYYVAGPPGLVASMRETLVAAGVDEDDVRAEEFAGY